MAWVNRCRWDSDVRTPGQEAKTEMFVSKHRLSLQPSIKMHHANEPPAARDDAFYSTDGNARMILGCAAWNFLVSSSYSVTVSEMPTAGIPDLLRPAAHTNDHKCLQEDGSV